MGAPCWGTSAAAAETSTREGRATRRSNRETCTTLCQRPKRTGLMICEQEAARWLATRSRLAIFEKLLRVTWNKEEQIDQVLVSLMLMNTCNKRAREGGRLRPSGAQLPRTRQGHSSHSAEADVA